MGKGESSRNLQIQIGEGNKKTILISGFSRNRPSDMNLTQYEGSHLESTAKYMAPMHSH